MPVTDAELLVGCSTLDEIAEVTVPESKQLAGSSRSTRPCSGDEFQFWNVWASFRSSHVADRVRIGMPAGSSLQVVVVTGQLVIPGGMVVVTDLTGAAGEAVQQLAEHLPLARGAPAADEPHS
jgi:hypothetical protein